jgi:hypothetical protein
MSELTEFTDPTPDLTDEELAMLREAGASEELIEVCGLDIEENDLVRQDGKTVQRNSVLVEVKKYLREWGAETSVELADHANLGGHFFQQLWEGDLFRAYSRADYNNKAILGEVFSEREINREKPSHLSRAEV